MLIQDLMTIGLSTWLEELRLPGCNYLQRGVKMIAIKFPEYRSLQRRVYCIGYEAYLFDLHVEAPRARFLNRHHIAV